MATSYSQTAGVRDPNNIKHGDTVTWRAGSNTRTGKVLHRFIKGGELHYKVATIQKNGKNSRTVEISSVHQKPRKVEGGSAK